MQKIGVGINGFGRIGRRVFISLLNNPYFEVKAINDLSGNETLAHLLKYDSVHGPLAADVQLIDDAFVVDGRCFKVITEKDPAKINWRDYGVSYVVESTGIYSNKADASKHLLAGASKVVISAPADGADLTIVVGVNDQKYDPLQHDIVSNSSCTTNCLAPIAQILDKQFGIEKASMTTVHAYTNDQNILDLPHKDFRRMRAASLSIIPTSTGAAKAVAQVLPELKGKIDGMALRVPTPNVSLVNLVTHVKKTTTKEEVNKVLRESSESNLRGILDYTEEKLVSIDYNGNTYSGIIDAASTNVINGDLVHIIAWYDNENGYANRVVDLLTVMHKADSRVNKN